MATIVANMNSPHAVMRLLLPILLVQMLCALKIGVSRVDTPASSTTTTTTTLASDTTATLTTATTTPTTPAITTTMDTVSSTIANELNTFTTDAPTNGTTATATETSKPGNNFTFAIFPPRLRTTTTTTTTTKPPSASSTPHTVTTTATTLDANATTVVSKTADGAALITQMPHTSGTYYCYCDLLLDACDLNCCCDRDCTREALRAFNCNVLPTHPELRSRLEDFHYQHGLPSCKINDGWLCVFRSNTHPERQQSHPDMDTSHYHKWPAPVWGVTDVSTTADAKNDYYRYDEPVQLLNMETMELTNFDLPYAYAPPHCQVSAPLRFLRSLRSDCLHSSADALQSHAKSLLNLAQTSKLLLCPLQQFSEPEQLERILGVLSMRKCQAEQCTTLGLTTDSAAMEADLDDFYPNEISITLLHNFTQLIAAFIELNETAPIDEGNELWQRYVVTFLYKNLTAETTRVQLGETATQQQLTSGPLGYLQGELVVVAHYVAHNRSEAPSTSNRVLSYFHPNATRARHNHTLRLFTQRQGSCHKSYDADDDYVGYGISTLKQCKVRLSNESLWWPSEQPRVQRNFTHICLQLQSLIAAQLFDAPEFLAAGAKPPEMYISRLGKPQNRSDKWIPLQLHNNDFAAPVRGEFNAQTQSFSCRNILLNVAYEFQVEQITEQNVPRQALIQHATLTFGQRNDLEFALDEQIEVPLLMSVMFYNHVIGDASGGAAESAQCIGLLISGAFIFYTTMQLN